MRTRTVFSPANQFRQGQYVTALGRNGIVCGWRRGPTGKWVVVKLTGRGNKDKFLLCGPADVTPRRGNNGRRQLLLPRLT